MKRFFYMLVMVLMAAVCFACEGNAPQEEDNKPDPCALKGDRPNWCDNDVVTEEDANAPPPTCGDGVCQSTYDWKNPGQETCENCEEDCGGCAGECGDGICDPSPWHGEDCDSCVEDCACGFGFSCTEDNDTFSCIDDPYYELKLVIPGTYQQLGATQLTNTIANDTAGYGCNGVLFSLEGTPWCIELQPTMLLSTCKGSPIGDKCQYEIPRTGKIWFDCANLGNEFGAQIKDWCDGLGSNYNCSSGVEQCGSTGIRVEMCNDEWAPGCWDDGGVGAAYLKLSSETE